MLLFRLIRTLSNIVSKSEESEKRVHGWCFSDFQTVGVTGLCNRLESFFYNRIIYTDICLTGAVLYVLIALVGALHQLKRFIALKPKDE